MKMNGFQRTTQQIGRVLTKNSPTILTGFSVAGLVTTVILAVRATPKALELIEMETEYRIKEDFVDMTKMDTIKLTYKCYIPAAIMGATTIACIVSSNSINLKRNAALASLYSLTETTLKEYRAKVVETIGEKKEKEIKDEIAKDTIKRNPVQESNVVFTGNGKMLCYDAISGRYFESDYESIRGAKNTANAKLLSEGYISLNNLYDELGLKSTQMGDNIGWRSDNGMFTLEESTQMSEDNRPCLVLSYWPEPSYDYMDAF